MQKEKLFGQLDSEDQIRFELYWNSIRNSLCDNCLVMDFNEHDKDCTLKLNEKNIESLDGLERLVQELPAHMKNLHGERPVTIIDLEFNKLRTVDIQQIMRCFAHIHTIMLSNNRIENVKFPVRIPDGVQIVLNNNKIKNVPVFKLGEGSTMSLQGNQLTEEARLRCLQAKNPSLFERQRHRIKALRDSQMWRQGVQFSCIAFLGAIIVTGVVTALIVGYTDGDLTNFIRDFLYIISNKCSLCKGILLMATLLCGSFGAWSYYWFLGYDDNVHHQYRPGTVVLDEAE